MLSASDMISRIEELVRNMPKRTRWHALASVCFAFVLYAIIVYPASVKLKRARGESEAIRRQMEVQTKLLPLYAKLKSLSQLDIPEELPQAQGTPITKNEVHSIHSRLAASAQRNGISLVSAIPQPNLKSGVVNLMPVDVVARGNFSDFRGFLLGASALPGFDSISHMEVTREVDREKLEARMWVIVE
jgi:hypothetical protein